MLREEASVAVSSVWTACTSVSPQAASRLWLEIKRTWNRGDEVHAAVSSASTVQRSAW